MKYTLCLLITIVLAGCTRQEDSQSNKQLLDSLGQDYWNRELRTGRESGRLSTEAIPLPEQIYSGSRKDFQDDSVYFSNLLLNLQSIETPKLPTSSLTDYDLLEWIATTRLDATRYFDNTFPAITPYNKNALGPDRIFSKAVFNNESDLNQYIELLRQYTEKQQSDLNRLQAMADHGIRIPKPEIDLILGQFKTMETAPDAHPFYTTRTRLSEFDSVTQKSFQQQVRDLLEKEIIPGDRSLANYLSRDYHDQAPEDVGLAQYPEGKAYYEYLVRWRTTTDLTPEAIHEIGEQSVQRVYSQLDSIRIATGFKGDLKDFYTFLRSDPRFLATTPEEVGERLRGHLKRMDKVVSKITSLHPKEFGDVRRLPLALEPAMTFGYYQPPSPSDTIGVYYYNGSKLDQRSLVSAASLAFHEITPGHHWQICLQNEQGYSDFRKNTTVTAFLEGWGEYASHLGIELGLYNDPYDYTGRLLMEMFFSVRLVVDTGMNYLGWTREQATAYMQKYLIESAEQIRTETLRYSCDIPGQALAYKLGSLRLIELREKYASALGEHFDLVKFHDAIFKSGNLPLSVLEKHLDREFQLND